MECRCWKRIFWKSATRAKRAWMISPFSKSAIALRFPEPPPLNLSQPEPRERFAAEELHEPIVAAATGSYFDALPTDDEVPDEIFEFFQPEAEEHLQVVSDCLISLEGNNNPEEIN